MIPETVRLTVAQAVVTFLSRQYSVADGQRRRLIPATLGIFGHGNAAGLGQALDQLSDAMPFIQGRNEQALVHAATAFAKHRRRHAALAVTSSIGPGALNMVTGAALATVNRLPVLLLPGDTYATRHQGPVLQQLQHPLEADVTVNDAFRPVCRFFDRITRPEQLLTALPAAMRVLTDPVDAGAVVLSLPQDIQSHAYDWPARFFAERDWVIRRPQPDSSEVDAVLAMLAAAARPLIIAGGGAIYSGATDELERLAGTAGIPVAETFAGKGAVQQRAWWQIGGIGLEGTPAANTLAREADLVLTIGARLTDFATADYLRLDLVQVAAGLGARALRARGAAGAGRDARLPGTGRDRGAGHPARRPARLRSLVGCRPSRGIDPGGHRRAAGRVQDRPEGPEVVRMSAGPLTLSPWRRPPRPWRPGRRCPVRSPHPGHLHRRRVAGGRRGLRRGRGRLGAPRSRARGRGRGASPRRGARRRELRGAHRGPGRVRGPDPDGPGPGQRRRGHHAAPPQHRG